MHLDGERVAVAVPGIAGGHSHPAFADAIFFDIGLRDSLEADADVARVLGCRRPSTAGSTVDQPLAFDSVILAERKWALSVWRISLSVEFDPFSADFFTGPYDTSRRLRDETKEFASFVAAVSPLLLPG